MHLRAKIARVEGELQGRNAAVSTAAREVRDHVLRFRSMAETLPDIIWVTQADGLTVFMNKVCERFIGVPHSAESVRAACRRLIHPEDYGRVIEHALECFTKSEGGRWQFRILCPEEGYRWFDGSFTPLFSESGPLTHWLLRSSDIHEKTLALNQAFASDQKLQSIFNSLPIVIWTVNNHGICDFLDGRLLPSFGLKPNQLVGLTYADFFNSQDIAIENYRRAVAGEEFSSFREIGDRLFEIHYSQLFESDGKRLGIVGIGVDITALRKRDVEREEFRIGEKAAIEASRLKSEFLASLGHEIRAPLNGLIGMTSLLRGSVLTAEQLPIVESIVTCSKNLLQVVAEALDFSKIEVGKMLLEAIIFDLHACLRHAHAIASVSAREKSLQLQLELAEDLPRLVSGDVHRLQQILLNLLSNAVKFTETGGISLECYATARDPVTHLLKVVVSDTGIGMSRDQITQIFPMSTQVAVPKSRRFGGYGLGLVIARNLCEAMNGSLSVQSVEGEGSQISFTVELGVAARMDAGLKADVDVDVEVGMQSAAGPRSEQLLMASTLDDVFADFDGDTVIFEELSRLFQEQRIDLEVGIARAIDEGDFEALVNLSHVLRGTLCNFTSVLGTPSAEALERAARLGDLAGARSYFDVLRPELDQLAAHMDLRRRPPVSESLT